MGKQYVKDMECVYRLMAKVFQLCAKDFRLACEAWKKDPCPETMYRVNKTYQAFAKNPFAPYAPIDLEIAAKKIYYDVMEYKTHHLIAVRRCHRIARRRRQGKA